MGDSLEGGTGDGPPEAENVAVVEYSTFASFLKKAVTILLPEEEDVIPPALNSALNDRNNQDCVHKFLSDPQVSCLFVQRISSKGWSVAAVELQIFHLLDLITTSVDLCLDVSEEHNTSIFSVTKCGSGGC
jgi:hypothetical protein